MTRDAADRQGGLSRRRAANVNAEAALLPHTSSPTWNTPTHYPLELNPFRNHARQARPQRGPSARRECSPISAGTSSSPKSATCMSLERRCAPGTKFHPNLPDAESERRLELWHGDASCSGTLPPFLIKGRYGEPMLHAHLQQRCRSTAQNNGGFGRNETQLHFHNGHNGAESDGATERAPLPWHVLRLPLEHRRSRAAIRSTRHATDATRVRPERQWRAHQGAGRLARTAGHAVGPRSPLLLHGRERLQGQSRHGELCTAAAIAATRRSTDGVNLRLPSGTAARLGQHRLRRQPRALRRRRPISTASTSSTSSPSTASSAICRWSTSPISRSSNVLPRKYRFRILNCLHVALLQARDRESEQRRRCRSSSSPTTATSCVSPVTLTELDQQGIAERYDIVVDFSHVPDRRQALPGQPAGACATTAAGPKDTLSLGEALAGRVRRSGRRHQMLEFRVVRSVQSVDEPGRR